MALTEPRLLVCALEASYGTDATPSGSDVLRVMNPNLTPLDAEVLERPVLDSKFGVTRSNILAMRKMKLSFDVEVSGSGTAGTAPRLGRLLQACGMNVATVSSTSNTYTFVTPAADSVTLGAYLDGNLHKGLGCRGGFELKMASGAIPMFSFDMTGIFVLPTDVSFPSATYANQADPVHVNGANTTSVVVAGYSACLSEFSLQSNPTIEFFDNAGCTPQVRITGRKVQGSLTIERPDTIAAKDFYTQAIAGTTGAITFIHGPAGNRLTPTVTAANFGPPEIVDLKGVAGIKIPYTALHTPGASDAVTLVYT